MKEPAAPAAGRIRRITAEGFLGAARIDSMAWFRDRLYVATSASLRQGPEDRARIHTFDSATGAWETIFDSPLLPLNDRARARAFGSGPRVTGEPDKLGRDVAYPSMLVTQARSDSAACLYCGTASIWGGLILRSEDGQRFEPAAPPGLGDDTRYSVAGLAALDGRLFALTAGTVSLERFDPVRAPQAVVHVSDDPASGAWTAAGPRGFDDPANLAVSALATAHGHVYAATANPLHGFQLWRTRAEGAPPFAWERALADGTWRFARNPAVTAMAAFADDLYLGTGPFAPDSPQDPTPPAGAELLRLRANGEWDLLIGEPRFTPEGLKVPLSASGPGFEDADNSTLRTLAIHQGQIIASTGRHPAVAHPDPQNEGELMSSPDGVSWSPLSGAIREQLALSEVRLLCSTPRGLFLATSGRANQGSDGAPTQDFGLFLVE